jgi:hypothetical protein
MISALIIANEVAESPVHSLAPTHGEDLDVVLDRVFLVLGRFDFCFVRFLGQGLAQFLRQF